MTLSLLRQACQRPQALMFRQTATACLFSTTTRRAKDSWDSVIGGAKDLSRLSRPTEEKWKLKSELFFARHGGPLRDAYTGRSVAVYDGDVAGAAKVLDRVVAQNNIAREWFTNRRHKQKGEERRKLKSIRWRRRFKHEVGQKVQLVQQIRRRGA